MILDSVIDEAGGGVRFGKLFAASFKIICAHWNPILVIAIVLAVPGYLLFDIPPLYGVGALTTTVCTVLDILLGIAEMSLLSIVVETIVDEASVVELKKVFKKALGRFPASIYAQVSGMLLSLALMVLLIIPGVVRLIYYSFVIQAVVLRNIGGIDALDYSKSLVKGHWWKVFGILVVSQLPGMVLYYFHDYFVNDLSVSNILLAYIYSFFYGIIEAFFNVVTIVMFLALERLKSNQSAAKVSVSQ